MTLEEMVEILEASSAMILDEGDREYVRGVKILMDLGEVVPQEVSSKVLRIYRNFVELEHETL